MKGLYILCHANIPERRMGDNGLQLLLSHPDLEIMRQRMTPASTVWLSAADDKSTLEFFYVLSGRLTITLGQSEEQTLESGDSFYVDGLEEDVLMRADVLTHMLYVTNRPLYDAMSQFTTRLKEVLYQIDEKDQYTAQHSLNVMNYVCELLKRLPRDALGQTTDEVMAAALFHDVGKCKTPDAVLKKSARLTPEEYQQIKRHPIDSAEMLSAQFGEAVSEIVRHHHERLDGSGYPDGLTGDRISLAARILAVADSFDAMTSKRIYNQPRTYLSAAEELYQMPDQYERLATQALLELVREGKFGDQPETVGRATLP